MGKELPAILIANVPELGFTIHPVKLKSSKNWLRCFTPYSKFTTRSRILKTGLLNINMLKNPAFFAHSHLRHRSHRSQKLYLDIARLIKGGIVKLFLFL